MTYCHLCSATVLADTISFQQLRFGYRKYRNFFAIEDGLLDYYLFNSLIYPLATSNSVSHKLMHKCPYLTHSNPYLLEVFYEQEFTIQDHSTISDGIPTLQSIMFHIGSLASLNIIYLDFQYCTEDTFLLLSPLMDSVTVTLTP